MRKFFTLFRKDIRRHWEEYFILFFVSVVMGLARVFDEPEVFDRLFLPLDMSYKYTTAHFQILYGFFRLFYRDAIPAIFLYSITSERISGRLHLIYSLPVRHSTTLLCSLASVMIMGTLLFLPGRFLYDVLAPNHHGDSYFQGIVSGSIFLCGIFCAIEGFLSLVKRNRLLFGMGVMFAVVVAMRYSYYPVTKAIRGAMSSIVLNQIWSSHFYFMIYVSAVHTAYPICVGILLTAVGLVLTEKYGEVE